jgi:regulator of protease activity HflC (stomatin/prohibitin superfamily)
MFTFIQTSTTGLRSTLGKFTATCPPGINFKIPFIQKINVVCNKTQQINCNLNIKTKDDILAEIHLSIQYRVMPEDSEKAYFSLQNPIDQINAYIDSSVRSIAQQKKINEIYLSGDEITDHVKTHLQQQMKEYGYTIVNTLITEINLPKEVREAMNKIVASERLKQATINEAEANYIREIKQAEADKERKRLQGEGIAAQRAAILDGYNKNIGDLSTILGVSTKEIMEFVVKTQHMDTMETIGKSNNSKIIFLNHDNPQNSLIKPLISSE